ncbi:MAG: zinc-binding dehydrogenase [Rhodospirillales bacterium]|nr:zinc-binding dehydrogenase [Rhodospirillales bacterium]MCY4096823.1 zinc-binding dehydrogenase [Rhodospirillales bacterium]MXX22708.1 zinc-binding dehydrogenase [Rhodospirillales bacterium]MYE19416.1 zinc-binding dehydrogenase [Rhodospirillales bacterium]
MRGLYFLGNRELDLREIPDPAPGPGEVVLKIKASGMCGSDLKFYRPPPGEAQRALGLGDDVPPIIGGHEPCGVVAERGAGVTPEAAPIDARVMNHHYAGCGLCSSCRVGWTQMCETGPIKVYGVTADGAHADYIVVPAVSLVPLPEALSFAEGSAIACGTGTAYGALCRLPRLGGSTLAVFGLGPVGLSAALLGEAMGARVIAVEVGSERLALATEFGADATVDAASTDPVEALMDLTHGRGVDLAIDCSASSAARSAAVRSTGRWGTVCFVGEGGDVTIDVSRDMIRKQLSIIGSWTFSATGQAECARFIADRKIPLEKIFTHRYTIDEAVDAYRLFDTQTTGKGVFLFD